MSAGTLLLTPLALGALCYLVAIGWRYHDVVQFRKRIRADVDEFVGRMQQLGELEWKTSTISGSDEPRGIVLCAGGRGLLTEAYTNLDVLRNLHGCRLPVELYYVGDEEMPTRCRAFFEETFSPLRCVDATRVPGWPGHEPTRNLRGFPIKVFSLLASRFEQLLFLDADSVPLIDPETLFEESLLGEMGNTFWPASPKMSTLVRHPDIVGPYGLTDGTTPSVIQALNPRIYEYLGLPIPSAADEDVRETDSGQFLVDRSRVFAALQLAWFINNRSRHFYLYMMGDADSFRLAFALAGLPFGQIPHPPGCAGIVEDGYFRGRALLQRDGRGEPIFLHQVARKPRLEIPLERLTHICDDPIMRHPRPRRDRGTVMLARTDELTTLATADRLQSVEDFLAASLDALRRRDAEAGLPAPVRPTMIRRMLNRRLLPW